MSNELLDFTKRDNFDFLKFTAKVKDEDDKYILKRKCEMVLEFAHATVQDMCLLGWHLRELKNSKTWQEVFDPKSGVSFSNFSFQDFCEYAFGFSKTRTSNLLSLSEFVKISGTKTSGFIEERYAEYNTSQLIELSSVPSGQQHYFSPDMSVKDIRLVKKYVASDGFWNDKQRNDFDLLTFAKNYAEQGQGIKKSSDILPGQIGIDECEEIPTSELAEDGDEAQDEEEYKPNGGVVVTYYDLSAEDVEDSDEYDEAYEDMQSEMQTIEEDSERSVTEEKEYDPCELVKGMSPWFKPDFKNRDGIREFYRGFRNWEQVYSGVPFIEIYRYSFKIGTLYAVCGKSADILTVEDERERTETAWYFWKEKDSDLRGAFGTNKFDLEKFITAHKDEL